MCVCVCDVAIMPDVRCSSFVHNVHYYDVAICSSVHTLELIIMINSILTAFLYCASIFVCNVHINGIIMCTVFHYIVQD